MNLQALKNELTAGHPGTGPYSPDDVTAADQLNAVNRTREKGTISGAQIYNAIVPAEWTALTNAQRDNVRDIFHLGDSIDVRTGTNARTVLLSIFGPGTGTRTNLAAAVQEPCSRAVELFGQSVTPSHIADARRLP